MKWQSFRFPKRRKPIHRTARTRLGLEELESRLLLTTNVLTYEYNNSNSGVDSTETQLTPANVSSGSFNKLFNTQLDGQVYGQPLVDNGVTINNGPNTTANAAGVHNVVFVATENDSLYAIDADPSSSGQILWQRSFLNANDPNDALAGATSVTAVDMATATAMNDIAPTYGITSTSVIDPSTNTLYLIADTQQLVNGVVNYVQTLHAINISDGTDATQSFVIGDTTGTNDNNTSITVAGDGPGSVTNGSGQSVVQFNARYENSRAALRVENGTLYAEFSAHANAMPYYGWILAWNVSDLSQNGLQLSGVMNTNPDGGHGGIWQGGSGLTFTPDGNDFYFTVGNGNGPVTVNNNGFPTDYLEAVVEATLDPSITAQNPSANGWGFQVVQFFIPAEGAALGDADKDMDSGVALLPASAGIPGHPNLLVSADKLGQLFLLDADDLGGFNPTNQNILDAATNAQGEYTAPSYFHGDISTPVYFNGQLYVVGAYSDPARSFTINSDGTLTPDSQTSDTLGAEPGSPVISADGTQNGIVWIMDRSTNELQAYDANNLGDELWGSGQGANALGSTNVFASPTVANGMVFVGTATGLVAYGLTGANGVSQAPTLTATAGSSTSVNLSWQDPSQLPNIATSYQIEESTDGGNTFTPVTTAPQGATSLTLGGLTPGITYSFSILGVNSFGDSANSNVVTVTMPATVNYTGGFANSSNQLSYNGQATINGSAAQLTDGGTDEATSVFTSTPVNIDSFQSQFTFQVSPGSSSALGDGFTFTIQGDGPTARGATGGALGYGNNTATGTGGLANSVAIKFDLYDNDGEGSDSTGLYIDGATPTVPAIDLTNTGINLHSGDVFQVNMTYDGTTLTVVITDTDTGATATQNYTIDIPSTVGGDSAYVGFTGGSGGATAIQDIRQWSFDSSGSPAPAAPSNLAAAGSGQAIVLSWTNNAGNPSGFYLDRATDANFTQNLITEALPGGVSSFTDTASGLLPGVTYYYRLRAFNASGSSANTSVVSATDTSPPSAPTYPNISGVTTSTIGLRWTDNAGSTATGYQIYRSTAGGAFTLVATLPSGSTSWTDHNLSAGTTYTYHIVTFNAFGSSGYAAVTAKTTPSATASPSHAATPEQAAISLLTSLIDLEIDAFLLVTYLEEGDIAEAKQMWSDIASNPELDSPFGLYALEAGFSMAKH